MSDESVPGPGSPRLRIGVLLDSSAVPQWVAAVLGDLATCSFVSVELVVFNGEAASNGHRWRTLLFSVYERLDRHLVSPAQDTQRIVDAGNLLSGWKAITVVPARAGFEHRFAPETIRDIEEMKLDVIVRFGFDVLRGDLLTAARCGVWSFHHGDSEHYRGGPACFREMLERNPLSGAELQVHTREFHDGMVLRKAIFATAGSVSLSRNRLQPYWGAAVLLVEALRQLHDYGWEQVRTHAHGPVPREGGRAPYRTPSNAEMLVSIAPRLLYRVGRYLLKRRTMDRWRLAIRRAPELQREDGQPTAGPASLAGFRWIEAPAGHSHADPFLVEEGGKQWVFFEDQELPSGLGRIACAQVDGDVLGTPSVALTAPHHLSYPCVFRDGETWFMIPESRSAGTVDLYRCERFPDAWRFERTLFRGGAVDTTIWIEGGTYWFFVTRVEPRSRAQHLWLYSAQSLTGPWTAHPASPISSDVRHSRGAGALFRRGGRLFRPSQDCSGGYGRRIFFNEVRVLDGRNYLEVSRCEIAPDAESGLAGVHTYATGGSVEIIDGKVYVDRAKLHS